MLSRLRPTLPALAPGVAPKTRTIPTRFVLTRMRRRVYTRCMETLPRVADTLAEMREVIYSARDNEISQAAECLSQYVTDHHDTAAYRENDRQVARLAKTFDRMIAWLDKAETQVRKIEAGCENFYGD